MHKGSPKSHIHRKGAALVEYVILAALVGLASIFSVLQIGTTIQTFFGESSTTMRSGITVATNSNTPLNPDNPGNGNPNNPENPEDDPNNPENPEDDPNNPENPEGNSFAPNIPGGAPPFVNVVALEFGGMFHVDTYLGISCVSDPHNVTGPDIWCIGDPLETRPSNLEWRLNTSTGAPIWHGQLCMYNTSTNSFVLSRHYVYDMDNATIVPGLAEYDNTWLMCQNHNTPSAGLLIDNVVASWDGSEIIWVPGLPTHNVPNTISFPPIPTWSNRYSSYLNNGAPTHCIYSTDMQRWITYDMYVQNGALIGFVPCY